MLNREGLVTSRPAISHQVAISRPADFPRSDFLLELYRREVQEPFLLVLVAGAFQGEVLRLALDSLVEVGVGFPVEVRHSKGRVPPMAHK
jgi:hypothetical protein